MSTPYVPVQRRHDVIGCMIRPGFTPGSFSHNFGQARVGAKRPSKGSINSREICEAANRVLEKRGLLNQPNQQDSTQYGGFRRY